MSDMTLTPGTRRTDKAKASPTIDYGDFTVRNPLYKPAETASQDKSCRFSPKTIKCLNPTQTADVCRKCLIENRLGRNK